LEIKQLFCIEKGLEKINKKKIKGSIDKGIIFGIYFVLKKIREINKRSRGCFARFSKSRN
jgi:hypothetical protein